MQLTGTKKKKSSGNVGSIGSGIGKPQYTNQSNNYTQRAASTRLKSSGGGSGGTPKYASNSSGQYGGVPAAPTMSTGGGPVPDINSFLGGDTGYQQQLRQLMKALNDFSADADRRKGTLESEYGVSKKALGDQRLMDLDAIEDDYGARGLIRSGLYGNAVGDYEKEFGLRQSDLDRRQQQALGSLSQERSQFDQQNKLSQQAAREAAIRRRAESYGV